MSTNSWFLAPLVPTCQQFPQSFPYVHTTSTTTCCYYYYHYYYCFYYCCCYCCVGICFAIEPFAFAFTLCAYKRSCSARASFCCSGYCSGYCSRSSSRSRGSRRTVSLQAQSLESSIDGNPHTLFLTRLNLSIIGRS